MNIFEDLWFLHIAIQINKVFFELVNNRQCF